MDVARLLGRKKRPIQDLKLDRDDGALATLEQKVAMTEYENARFFLTVSSEQVMSRFNFFILLTSAAIASSSAVTTSATLPVHFKALFATVAGVLILTVGSLAFQRLAHFDVVRAEYLATINLIRGYFAAQAPLIAPYFVIPVQVLNEPWGWKLRPALQNLSTTVSIINSMAAAIVAPALVSILVLKPPISILYVVGIGSGILCAGIHWFAQRRIATCGKLALSNRLEALAHSAKQSPLETPNGRG